MSRLSLTILCCSIPVTAAWAVSTEVETYVATGTLSVALPGTPGTSDITFNYSFQFDTIDFTPGAVVFVGQPVDFDGTEASWLASTETGQIKFDTTSGPATANVEITGTRTGGVIIVNVTGQATGVEVGPGFSASLLDGILDTLYYLDHLKDQLLAPLGLIPSGTILTHTATHQITGIDVINGIVQVNITGSFLLEEGPVAVESSTWGDVKAEWRDEGGQ